MLALSLEPREPLPFYKWGSQSPEGWSACTKAHSSQALWSTCRGAEGGDATLSGLFRKGLHTCSPPRGILFAVPSSWNVTS